LDQAPPAHPVPPNPEGDPATADELSQTEIAGSDVSGRTRPRFEELPPGPPTWPGWIFAVLALLVTLAGLVVTGLIAYQRPGESLAPGAWLTIVGLLGCAAGCGWVALASIIRRRALPRDRYRGPSIFVMLAIVFALGNLGLPLVLLAGGDLNHLGGALNSTLLILPTPLAFLIAVTLFGLAPRALEGVRLTDGAATASRLAHGVLIGLAVAFLADLLLLGVTLLVKLLTGEEPAGEQAVVGLAQDLPAFAAVVTLVVVAPIAEELFFRVTVINAWEREYGTVRAVIGSSLLFAVIHLVGGTWLALVPILPLGFLLGLIYVRWRSLPLNFGVHAGFNLLATIALLASR
jgi:membrane protease YdiL (CAAX protease family)